MTFFTIPLTPPPPSETKQKQLLFTGVAPSSDAKQKKCKDRKIFPLTHTQEKIIQQSGFRKKTLAGQQLPEMTLQVTTGFFTSSVCKHFKIW